MNIHKLRIEKVLLHLAQNVRRNFPVRRVNFRFRRIEPESQDPVLADDYAVRRQGRRSGAVAVKEAFLLIFVTRWQNKLDSLAPMFI